MSEEKIYTGLAQHVLKGFFWLSLQRGGNATIQVLAIIVLARLLTPEDFGLATAALVIVGFSSLFSQLGIGTALVQVSTLEKRHISTASVLSLVFGIFLALLIAFFAPFIASFFHTEKLTKILWAMCPIFFFQSISTVPLALLQRELRFRELSLIELGSFIFGFLFVGLGLALAKFGVWAIIGAHVSQNLFRAIILLSHYSPQQKVMLFNRTAAKELFQFGRGVTLLRLAGYVAIQGDNLIVGRYLGPEALGFYSRAYQLMAVPAAVLGETLLKLLFPTLALVQNNPEKLITMYKRAIALSALIILPLSVVLAITTPEFVYIMLGRQWSGTILPCRILSVSMYFRAADMVNLALALALGATHKSAWRYGMFALFVLGGAWLAKIWGLGGVSFAVLIASILTFFLMTQLSLSLVELTWRAFISLHLPALLLTTLLGAESWIISTVLKSWQAAPLVNIAIVGTIVFFTLVLLIYSRSKIFLGEEGMWMHHTLRPYIFKPGYPLQFARGKNI